MAQRPAAPRVTAITAVERKSPSTTTGALAAQLGIHPNTLRWYESAGYLPTVPRTPGGYRRYGPELVRLARIVRESQPLLRLFGPIRRATFVFLNKYRDEGAPPYSSALQRLDELIALLRDEHRLALDALAALERFRRGEQTPPRGSGPLRPIGLVAAETGLTRDRIINWERDGLCRYPRSPAGYRLFGAEEIDRLLIIRSCRTAGFSLTAIRRLLRAIDEHAPEASVSPDGVSLRVVADTPAAHEAELFSAFPTDTLPATLEQFLALTERLGRLLRDAHPERCTRAIKPSN